MLPSNTKIIGKYTLEVDQLIGGGCFGEIYLGYDSSDSSKKVAIKKVAVSKLISSDFSNFIENERDIFKSISHPNIVKYYDSIMIADVFYLITEYCPLGLSGYMSQYPNKCIPEFESLGIINVLSQAMIYLNKQNIVHRNLYPSNILFQDGKIPKICSFAFAVRKPDINQIPGLAASVGIPLYEAPEIYYKKPYSFKCDVWSLGLVFYQMLYGKLPWAGKGLSDLFEKISKDELLFPEEPKISENTKDLIKQMLKVDPSERCDWQRVFDNTMNQED